MNSQVEAPVRAGRGRRPLPRLQPCGRDVRCACAARPGSPAGVRIDRVLVQISPGGVLRARRRGRKKIALTTGVRDAPDASRSARFEREAAFCAARPSASPRSSPRSGGDGSTPALLGKESSTAVARRKRPFLSHLRRSSTSRSGARRSRVPRPVPMDIATSSLHLIRATSDRPVDFGPVRAFPGPRLRCRTFGTCRSATGGIVVQTDVYALARRASPLTLRAVKFIDDVPA